MFQPIEDVPDPRSIAAPPVPCSCSAPDLTVSPADLHSVTQDLGSDKSVAISLMSDSAADRDKDNADSYAGSACCKSSCNSDETEVAPDASDATDASDGPGTGGAQCRVTGKSSGKGKRSVAASAASRGNIRKAATSKSKSSQFRAEHDATPSKSCNLPETCGLSQASVAADESDHAAEDASLAVDADSSPEHYADHKPLSAALHSALYFHELGRRWSGSTCPESQVLRHVMASLFVTGTDLALRSTDTMTDERAGTDEYSDELSRTVASFGTDINTSSSDTDAYSFRFDPYSLSAESSSTRSDAMGGRGCGGAAAARARTDFSASFAREFICSNSSSGLDRNCGNEKLKTSAMMLEQLSQGRKVKSRSSLQVMKYRAATESSADRAALQSFGGKYRQAAAPANTLDNSKNFETENSTELSTADNQSSVYLSAHNSNARTADLEDSQPVSRTFDLTALSNGFGSLYGSKGSGRTRSTMFKKKNATAKDSTRSADAGSSDSKEEHLSKDNGLSLFITSRTDGKACSTDCTENTDCTSGTSSEATAAMDTEPGASAGQAKHSSNLVSLAPAAFTSGATGVARNTTSGGSSNSNSIVKDMDSQAGLSQQTESTRENAGTSALSHSEAQSKAHILELTAVQSVQSFDSVESVESDESVEPAHSHELQGTDSSAQNGQKNCQKALAYCQSQAKSRAVCAAGGLEKGRNAASVEMTDCGSAGSESAAGSKKRPGSKKGSTADSACVDYEKAGRDYGSDAYLGSEFDSESGSANDSDFDSFAFAGGGKRIALISQANCHKLRFSNEQRREFTGMFFRPAARLHDVLIKTTLHSRNAGKLRTALERLNTTDCATSIAPLTRSLSTVLSMPVIKDKARCGRKKNTAGLAGKSVGHAAPADCGNNGLQNNCLAHSGMTLNSSLGIVSSQSELRQYGSLSLTRGNEMSERADLSVSTACRAPKVPLALLDVLQKRNHYGTVAAACEHHGHKPGCAHARPSAHKFIESSEIFQNEGALRCCNVYSNIQGQVYARMAKLRESASFSSVSNQELTGLAHSALVFDLPSQLRRDEAARAVSDYAALMHLACCKRQSLKP